MADLGVTESIYLRPFPCYYIALESYTKPVWNSYMASRSETLAMKDLVMGRKDSGFNPLHLELRFKLASLT